MQTAVRPSFRLSSVVGCDEDTQCALDDDKVFIKHKRTAKCICCEQDGGGYAQRCIIAFLNTLLGMKNASTDCLTSAIIICVSRTLYGAACLVWSQSTRRSTFYTKEKKCCRFMICFMIRKRQIRNRRLDEIVAR